MTNRLALPFSAHFDRELDRRRTQLTGLINGETEDTFRPHSLAPDTAVVPTNHSCILPSIKLTFRPLRSGAVRQMKPAKPWLIPLRACSLGNACPRAKALLSGQTCRTGQITESQQPSQGVLTCTLMPMPSTSNSVMTFSKTKPSPMTPSCRPTRIGVPLGQTYRRCTDDEHGFGPQASNPQHPEDLCGCGGRQV